MNIEIPDEMEYQDAIKLFKKSWLLNEMKPNESVLSLSKRVGLTWKTTHKLLGQSSELLEAMNDKKECLFCKTDKELHEHHIYGRKIDRTVYLCKDCHMLFHRLNGLYKK